MRSASSSLAEGTIKLYRMDDLDKALSFHRQGKLEEAEKIYSDILRKDKNNPEILQLLGTINLQLKDYKISEEYFLKSLKK